MLKPAPGKPATTAPFHVLAVDAVRFVGQPVAVVLAESRAAAERAANLVTVDYDPLPAVATLAAALAPAAPLVWPDAPGNVAGSASFGDRDACDRAFAAAKHVTRIAVDNQRLVAGHARTARLRGGVRCGLGPAHDPRDLAEPGQLPGHAGEDAEARAGTGARASSATSAAASA